ncbi:MAG TPA: hypothetical protein VJV79_11585 [Polyangiaceae bacterium]|nr:hypothetical protein [Polyangiaceae bacterium]
MPPASSKFSVLGRQAFYSLAVAAQVCVACAGASDSASVGGAAGSNAEGGESDQDAGRGAAAGNAGTDPTAGALASGGDAAAAGQDTAGGAAGLADAEFAGASGAASAGFVPAPHAPFPLVTDHGGPRIKNIELVPVYFGDDPLRAELERFNSWIVESNYWKHTGAEYGVHPGTRLPAIQFESVTAASISDTEIANWIDARIADGGLPKPNENTLFALFYQAGTTITTGPARSCREFAAAHKSVAIANPIFTGNVPYAIIPRCSFSPGDELMIATDVASHEYMEAATCPYPHTDPTWLMDNLSGPLEAWWGLSGPAVPDLCLNQSYDMIEGFSVNDIWSNAAAQAGNNPCQPSDPKHPFFSVSAEQTIYHAQPGATLIIKAVAWSNLPTKDWSLGVNWGWVPDSDFDGHAVLSTETVNNGDEVTATVTIPLNPPVVNGRSAYRFTIDSIDPINPNFSHPWPFLVIVP